MSTLSKGVIVYTEKRAICSLRLYTRSEGQKATQEALTQIHPFSFFSPAGSKFPQRSWTCLPSTAAHQIGWGWKQQWRLLYMWWLSPLLHVIIITIVSQNSKLSKEVRYVLLCHHLLCMSSCGLGVVFQGMWALLANSPVLGGVWGTANCWRRDSLHSGLDGCQHLPSNLLALEISVVCRFS